jgi:heat shock protein HtpX
LTGSPAALASALRRLDETSESPPADLREWERSVAALNVLPPAHADVATGPFRTHPPADERVEHLRDMVESAESRA